ncbi:MAG: AraC family transcriptional regulator [Pseudodesulfovibrio sp.]
MQFSKNNPMIEFGFFLEGSFTNTINLPNNKTMELNNRAGQFGMGYQPEMSGAVRMAGERKLRIIHLHVMPSKLSAMLGPDLERIAPHLLDVLEEKRAVNFVRQQRQTPLIQAVANELFYGVRNEAPVRLYVEGKVSELLALSLMGTSAACADQPLCPRLRDTLYAIRSELEALHDVPPTLSAISARYHVPIATIQGGFKTLFGMSVFAFVKEYRLQLARRLFAEGDMNVSEVAWEIGYTNLSHFSSAYRKRFGVLPKAYLQSVREFLHTPSQ